MASVLITGANRGIGLGFVKLILSSGSTFGPVIATFRDQETAKELNDLKETYKNLHVLQLEVTKFDTFKKFLSEVEQIVGEKGLNVLINNAAVILSNTPGDLAGTKVEDYKEVFDTNTFGPIFLTQTLLPLVKLANEKNTTKKPGINGGVIFNISSLLGSIADNKTGGYWGYRESKAALNQFTRNLAKELNNLKIVVVAVHPGQVKTEMGGPTANISVEESVKGMFSLLNNINHSKSDKFLQYDGKELPW